MKPPLSTSGFCLYFIVFSSLFIVQIDSSDSLPPPEYSSDSLPAQECSSESSQDINKDLRHYLESVAISDHCKNLTFDPIFEKFVFVIIDALPYRFLRSLDDDFDGDFRATRMPFLEEVVRSQGISLKSIASMPTVTTPGVKALTGGIVPSMFDYINNLDASSFSDENILRSFRKQNRRIVFYGDEVWGKLFKNPQEPDGIFHRFNSTDSFFATDYVFVDKNVTWNVENELKSVDSWDVMILHYLGVDHIGHLDGSKSSLFNKKLLELDSVIERIFLALKNSNSLIVVTSDHGMTDDGNHGGDSRPEVETPMFFISTSANHSKYSSTSGSQKLKTVKQTDFCPTVSALFGLEIPGKSSGILIPEVLERFRVSKEQFLCSLFENSVQIRRNSLNSVANSGEENFQESLEEALNFHFRSMDFGPEDHFKETVKEYSKFLTGIQGNFRQTDLFSSENSLIYFAVLGFFLLLTILLLGYENRIRKSSIVYQNSGIMFLVIVILDTNIACRGSEKFLLLESHYWTFMQQFLLILELFQTAFGSFSKSPSSSLFNRIIILFLFVPITFWRQIKSTDERFEWTHYPDVFSALSTPEMTLLKNSLFLAAGIFLLSFRKSFGNFLETFLFAFKLISLVSNKFSNSLPVWFQSFGTVNLWAKLFFLIVALELIARIFFALFKNPENLKNPRIRILDSLIQAWLEISLLSVDSALVPLIAIVRYQESLISGNFLDSVKFRNLQNRQNLQNPQNPQNLQNPRSSYPLYQYCFYLTFAFGGFFQLENSNQLSTVSVSACFIGQESFNFIPCGFLMINSIYCLYVFWILAMFRLFLVIGDLGRGRRFEVEDGVDKKKADKETSYQLGHQDHESESPSSSPTVSLIPSVARIQFVHSCATLTVQLFVTFHLRTRPFVWSLMAPKLLYDFVILAINSVVHILVLLLISDRSSLSSALFQLFCPFLPFFEMFCRRAFRLAEQEKAKSERKKNE